MEDVRFQGDVGREKFGKMLSGFFSLIYLFGESLPFSSMMDSNAVA